MDRASLIERITDLVIQELQRAGAGSAPSEAAAPPAGASGPTRRVLLCPNDGASGREGPVWDALRSAVDVEWSVVEWRRYPSERVAKALAGRPVRPVDPPGCWEELASRFHAVVIPFLTLDVLARTALLMADVPPVAAVAGALVQGVPVLAASDEVDRLRRHSARISGGLLSVVTGHLRTLEQLGVRLVAAAGLPDALGQGHTLPSRSGGRDVLTHEDLMGAVRSGRKVVDVAPGTIVTHLALETASAHGIEVRRR